jgi:hypothetical protein
LLHLVPSCGGPFVFGRRLLNLGHALRPCGLISGPMPPKPQFKMVLLVDCHTSDSSTRSELREAEKAERAILGAAREIISAGQLPLSIPSRQPWQTPAPCNHEGRFIAGG